MNEKPYNHPQTVIVYHFPCPDGFGAAFAAWKAVPHAKFLQANYGQKSVDTSIFVDKHVYILDFSYPQHIMREIASVASHVEIHDHHAPNFHNVQPLIDEGLIEGVLDDKHSGAVLAWKRFHPTRQIPEFLQYIEDRDLWNWKLPNSDKICAGISTLAFDFYEWDQVFIFWDKYKERFLERGAGVLAYKEQLLKDALRNVVPMYFEYDTHIAPIYAQALAVNCTKMLISEVANELAKKAPEGIGAGFFMRQDGRWEVSLRSIKPVECVHIAKAYGGGGHPQACGFIIDDIRELISVPPNHPE